jgi:hypothetical protein
VGAGLGPATNLELITGSRRHRFIKNSYRWEAAGLNGAIGGLMQSYSAILTMLLGVFIGGFFMHVVLSRIWGPQGDAERLEAQGFDRTGRQRPVAEWPNPESELEMRGQATFRSWWKEHVGEGEDPNRALEAPTNYPPVELIPMKVGQEASRDPAARAEDN